MASRRNRYKEMEQLLTIVLIADAVVFLGFLFAAGFGVTWMKVATAIVAIAVSVLSLTYLYLTRELLRPRSFWMSVGFAAITLCILVSLICNYPSPNELSDAVSSVNGTAVGTVLLP